MADAPPTPTSVGKPLPKKAVQLALALGRPDAHVQAAIATLDDKEAAPTTVRAAVDTLTQQVRGVAWLTTLTAHLTGPH
jgi:hypothetical protein